MSSRPAERGRDSFAAVMDDGEVARLRRKKLTRLATGAVASLVAVAIVAWLVPPQIRQRMLISIAVVCVMCGALPLLASLIQYLAVGLNRFYTGYLRLRPYYPHVAVIVPAWNEAEVIGTTIERLLAMDYPADRLRVYVVDDASTDATPTVVQQWASREPARVYHLRREKGGEGKAHTLNHGIAQVLREPWADALLIMDADVLFEDGALRRMARHLSNPEVGTVTAYIKEGTPGGNYLTRFIAYEYITAQAAARRAQNVFGTLACLAGGAQLHSRSSLESIGGRIDTSTLAEDTVSTFRTQLAGKRAVFEGNAVVWAEEPGDLVGLWKQRLRWSRGNVQVSLQFSDIWLDRRRGGVLGRPLFAFIWFTVLLMPIFMIAASSGLLLLAAIDEPRAWAAFRALWIFHVVIYLFVTAMSLMLDTSTARRTWVQACAFPGLISLALIIYSAASGPIGALLMTSMARIGIEPTARLVHGAQLFAYAWLAAAMLVAYAAKWIAEHWKWQIVAKMLIYVAGYGAFLCAVTMAAYVRELQGARLTWDKTVKTGKVVVPR